jgi:uncharacterized protein (DUF2235 family)
MHRHGPSSIKQEGPRKILLFSDGTGNSSAKLQRTNVWRLYEAIDLGYPVETGKAVQLAYYDDGVGTSSIKPLAILGGVFGLGLARNVLDIYKFLCRNYRPGDQIYAFGFSRGAYTIRLLVSFVATMGLVDYTQNEEELNLAARDNWREYRRGFHANNVVADFLVGFGRWSFRKLITFKRYAFGQLPYAAKVKGRRRNWLAEWWETTKDRWDGFFSEKIPLRAVREYGPDIEFVGVWDTVAAYGGPIVEITRAIDEWIWPLTMPNYRLSKKVKTARHALAIDDKRDAFTPLLWDEVYEKSMPGYSAKNPRLQQVWFAGMHADVGGGYSDDSLAYVSLWWMIEHAELSGAGIRLIPEYRDRIETFRNIYGTIHNSRGGAGMFYRYQPRYINAWLDGRPGSKILKASQIFRDPTIDHGRYRYRGLLNYPIRLHRSVEERLRMATDGYAPNNLPSRYRVDNGPAGTRPAATTKLSDKNPADAQNIANIRACTNELSSRIKLRRFWFFVSAWIATFIVLKPLWPDIWGLQLMVGSVDARTNAHRLEEAANAFIPSIAHVWTAAIAADPFVSAAAFGLLMLTSALGLSQERRMSGIAGRLWRERLTKGEPITGVARKFDLDALLLRAASVFHKVDILAKVLAWAKWRGIPKFTGFFLWLLSWYAAAAIATQFYLVAAEAWSTRCPAAPPGGARKMFKTTVNIAAPCTNTGLKVQSVGSEGAEKHYEVTVQMLDERGAASVWRDANQSASPEGWANGDNSWTQWLAWPFLRVTTAKIMQPVFEIRSQSTGGHFVDLYMMRPVLTKEATGSGKQATIVWKGELIIPRQFHNASKSQWLDLYVFVNDAVLPIDRVSPDGSLNSNRSACEIKRVGGVIDGVRALDLFPMDGRYHNNCGKMTISLTPLP